MLYISPLLHDCPCLSSSLPFTWPQAGSSTELPYSSAFTLDLQWSSTRSQSTSLGFLLKTEIYMNQVYIPLSSFHLTIPRSCLSLVIYINVRNTHASFTDPPLASSIPTTFRVYSSPEAIIVACLSSLIQARLMCYFLPWLVPAVLIKRDSPRFRVRPSLTALNRHVLLCLPEIFIS